MERDIDGIKEKWQSLNFNSHAHVERDRETIRSGRYNMTISTHTLTWSVTFWNIFGIVIFTCISTHTLTWSVTGYSYRRPHG